MGGHHHDCDYHCGYEEHQHTAACYEKVLTCGYEEGEPETPVTSSDSSADLVSAYSAAEPEELEEPVQTEPETIWVPHEHTDACYEEHRVLTCYQEEHEHTDDCFDEYGALICGEFEHIHDDSCYTTEYELVCGLDEGELVEEPNPAYQEMPASRPVVDLPPEPAETTPDEPVLHHHTDAATPRSWCAPSRSTTTPWSVWPIPRPTWRLPRNGRPRPTWP